jgi:hypothetical protein
MKPAVTFEGEFLRQRGYPRGFMKNRQSLIKAS